jgi:hypothetical protein
MNNPQVNYAFSTNSATWCYSWACLPPPSYLWQCIWCNRGFRAIVQTAIGGLLDRDLTTGASPLAVLQNNAGTCHLCFHLGPSSPPNRSPIPEQSRSFPNRGRGGAAAHATAGHGGDDPHPPHGLIPLRPRRRAPIVRKEAGTADASTTMATPCTTSRAGSVRSICWTGEQFE